MKSLKLKNIVISVFSSSVLLLSACGNAEQPVADKDNKKAKNIIFMIGDGMGVAHTSAYRYYADNPKTKQIETTVFDELLVGTARTYPADDTVVTDSAASATALSSGIKSYNGAIGVDVNKEPVLTLLEKAKQLGKTTAIVASSEINHATPASFITHNEYRKNYTEIADAYFDDQINGKPKADLMLGGGLKHFIRDDRNLVDEFKSVGYQFTDSLTTLDNLTSLPALGIFAPIGLPFAIDSEKPRRVTAMTKKAFELLDNENNPEGFFIMIEGSQVDWCSHGNDIACTMAEMDDFAHAVKLAKQYADSRDDTLLVITADHTTGGLSIGANGDYRWDGAAVKQFTSSISYIIADFMALPKDSTSEQLLAVWSKHSTYKLNDSNIKTLLKSVASPLKQSKLEKELRKIINSASNTGWTTGGHSAEDVQVFASGVNKQLFMGHQDNTDIAKGLFLQLEK